MEREEGPITEAHEQADIERIRALGRALRRKRVAERLTLERAAEQSDVSAATLSRLERQGEMKTKGGKGFITPDTRTIGALVRWLGVSLDEMHEGGEARIVQAVPYGVEGAVSTPEAVETYLRADRNLSPEAAAALAEMFRLAYQQFSRFGESRQVSKPLSLANDDDNQPSNHE